ncbi:hypothetical protein [Mycobacterium phage Weirdo19]|uniref:Uncharacterized protein n=1 Tax=Mycobacterium phage Weirdo19 TaxID=2601610 RepID=A0A6M2YT09_9CAUD|nr:hypothetical protein KDJ11_gp83 [Mycobacterium phage Weirdo19]QEA10851.1 hypothetical protein [Mycobacterium phage Weirdo19]
MSPPTIARTVVYRHRCHCDNANTTPGPGQADEHRFDVDGQPFPWHITEDGATFLRTEAGLYLVSVQILPYPVGGDDLVEFRHRDGGPPMLGDRPFPWAMTGTMNYSIPDIATDHPVLDLTFVAEHVDTDGEVGAL